MEQGTAPMSSIFKVITGLVLAMIAGFVLVSFYSFISLLAGLVLGVISFLCYLFAPVSYELTGDRLTVRFRWGKKVFSPVMKCSQIAGRLPFSLRIWGNGGLFAATGIFWNSSYGFFRAYVTSARPQDLVLVETQTQKIVISPQAPMEFIKSCEGTIP
jgi:hypothetical protein